MPGGPWAAALAAVLAVVAAAPLAAGPYREGKVIEIVGRVDGPGGEPVPEVKVVLEASRRTFSFSRLARTTRDATSVAAVTDRDGRFSIEWKWQDFYNHFELVAGVDVPRGGQQPAFRAFDRLDLSSRILQGTPVETALKVEDTEFIAQLREFLDTVDTADERRIYEQRGRPDRVATTDYPDHQEVSWWYFERGLAYHFRDGKLEREDRFDPVTPF